MPARGATLQTIHALNQRVFQLTALGVVPDDIALELELNPKTVKSLCRSMIGKGEILRLRKEIEIQAINLGVMVKENGILGATIVNETMTNEDNPLTMRVNLALDSLDRAGFSKTERIGVTVGGRVKLDTITKLNKASVVEAKFTDITPSDNNSNSDNSDKEEKNDE